MFLKVVVNYDIYYQVLFGCIVKFFMLAFPAILFCLTIYALIAWFD